MPRSSHHHGNLQQALIDAGLRLLDSGKPLTLRGAAQLAGVSHAAPAHHFDGLDGLKQAIAHRGFQMFRDDLAVAGAAAPDDPFARLLALNRAYLAFADRHEPLFRLMFEALRTASPDLLAIATDCYAILCRHCAPFARDARDAARLEGAVWSLTHGYALLRLDRFGPNAPFTPPPYEALLRLLLRP